MSDKKSPVRQTDNEAFSIARKLLGETRYASLGVTEPGTGIPLVSRVAAAWTPGSGLFFCASDLSEHSKCLSEIPACSLMIGEPGKGDGLAYPRITIIGSAQRLPNDNEQRAGLKKQFLAVHPKAALYIDFADFGFYPLNAERALLNGGFGKAYRLDRNDLATLHG